MNLSQVTLSAPHHVQQMPEAKKFKVRQCPAIWCILYLCLKIGYLKFQWLLGIYIYIVVRIQFASLRTLQPTSRVFGTSFSNQLHVFAASQGSGGASGSGRVGISRSLKPLEFCYGLQRQGSCSGRTWPFFSLSTVGRVFRDYCVQRFAKTESCRWNSCLGSSNWKYQIRVFEVFHYWIGSAVFRWEGARANYIGSGAPACYRSIQGGQAWQPHRTVMVPTPELALS